MTGLELYDLFGEEEEKLICHRSGMWDKVNEYKMYLFDTVAKRLELKEKKENAPKKISNITSNLP